MSYIYVASPYTHKSARVRSKRTNQVLKYISKCSQDGEVVFSPIVHSHPMAVKHGLNGTWEFWQHIDRTFIKQCEKVRVLKLSGWDKSVGIKNEIEYAQSIGKEVEYVEYTA